MDRKALRDSLLENVDVVWNRKFVSYRFDVDTGKVLATFEVTIDKGEEKMSSDAAATTTMEYEIDILVGADGANSIVRSQFMPNIVYKDLNITNVASSIPIDSKSISTKILQVTEGEGALVRWIANDGFTLMSFPYSDQVDKSMPRQLLWVLSFPGTMEEWKHALSTDAKDDEVAHDEYTVISKTSLRDKTMKYALDKAEGKFADDIMTLMKSTPPDTALFGPRQIYSVDAEEVETILKNNEGRIALVGDGRLIAITILSIYERHILNWHERN